MKKVAITGGIGSGKSTVLSILRNKGFVVFSCDEVYKEVITLKQLLGMGICAIGLMLIVK
jgi:dephospho-CoA kinase